MTYIAPGTCRHCRCTEDNACSLGNGEPCWWTNNERTVCSNPSCIKAEEARLARAKEAAKAAQPKRLRSYEVSDLIRRGNRRPKKGRAA
jgi:hypothetical protein